MMKWVVYTSLGLVVLVVVLASISRLTAAELKPGDVAPDFSLQGSDGKTHKLSDYRGKQAVVIAWFPKAFTAGCTAECKSLRSGGEKIREFNVAYFTASVDPPEKNQEFAKSLSLDYAILSDPDGKTAKAYGVTDAVRPIARRWTFYISKDGHIAFVDKNVNTAHHADDVVKKLETLGIEKRSAAGKQTEADASPATKTS